MKASRFSSFGSFWSFRKPVTTLQGFPAPGYRHVRFGNAYDKTDKTNTRRSVSVHSGRRGADNRSQHVPQGTRATKVASARPAAMHLTMQLAAPGPFACGMRMRGPLAGPLTRWHAKLGRPTPLHAPRAAHAPRRTAALPVRYTPPAAMGRLGPTKGRRRRSHLHVGEIREA